MIAGESENGPEDVVRADEFVTRVVAMCIEGGPMGLPRRARDRQILLKAIALTLDGSREHSEFEIDGAIQEWLALAAPKLEVDHVTLRRILVDEGYLVRDRRGAAYALGASRQAALFTPDVDAIHVWAVIDEARRAIAGRRRDGAG